MNPTLQHMMAKARELSRSGQLQQATAALQRTLQDALGAAGLPTSPMPHAGGAHHWPAGATPGAFTPSAFTPSPVPAQPQAPRPATPGAGEFLEASHTHQNLTRRYKLYVPAGARALNGPPPALVVMLHGCTQNPDDFAAGTGMNQRADQGGFWVLYPEQCQKANASRCWNWFKHNHQQRGRGEAALLADLTQAIVQQHGLDPRRVFIAGLSAGGAMAASVAAAYPEIYAGVGVHSGLPPGAANTLPEALAAMRAGAASGASAGVRGEPALAGATALPVPTIVFHGDQDTTVHPRNGQQVLAAALVPAGPAAASAPQVLEGRAGGGRSYTRTRFTHDAGHPVAEHWLVHGAGHAWSGGQSAGSYTDPSGPDATAEMLRFFFSQRG
jgi:poly(hydroxyalkanoate) depolymerase family esterase